ncbi:MAG TPA: HAD family hydrolase [Candidatus Baltobacteraceae bacterium]|nr:HAD family hydrolase [Candidatus Baltobacteraceae bacterium]
MPPDLVIFDCDGVLVDSEPVVTRVESQYFGTLGFTMDEHEMRRRFQGKTVGDVAAAVETQLGRALAPEELYAWGIATASALAESLRAVPGVTDVVDLVRTSGTPVCVASQSPLPRVRLSLAVTNLAAPFGGRIFTASMVARPKPAPDLFLHAAARMDAQPSRCIVIEDSLSGVRAARAAGMRVFGYADGRGFPAAALADAGAEVVTSMRALAEALAPALA